MAALLLVAAVFLAASCSSESGDGLRPTTRPEPWRSQWHYTPLEGWMNDPNGLVYYEGEYHLFYQYNPYLPLFGDMHWGHAVSTDLMHWEELDIALFPDADLGMAYSGSAVVARDAAAEVVCQMPAGKECLVAIFTHHGGTDGTEKQSLAYSVDRGRSWTQYDDNPVLPNPGIVDDFRDPKVFWHAPSAQWIMVLAAFDRIEFYGAPDLVQWSHLSSFGPQGDVSGEWECPELFELDVRDAAGASMGRRWLLKVDVNRGFSDSSPASQYFTGEFDGTSFVPDETQKRWVDHGSDFYAAQSFAEEPQGRRVWLAWMNNWAYALSAPTAGWRGWRGAMTIPRELELVVEGDALALAQRPVPELESLRSSLLFSASDRALSSGDNVLAEVSGQTLEIQLRMDMGDAESLTIGLARSASAEQETLLRFDKQTKELTLDRSRSGQNPGSDDFEAPHTLSLSSEGQDLEIVVLLDRSSVEVFANGGRGVLSERIFPDAKSKGLSLLVTGGEARIIDLQIHSLQTIWPVSDM